MRSKSKFFIEKTKSSLKQLGLVALIISLSVMFSSLCIMSLISLSDSLYSAMLGNPRSQIGGEVKAYIPPEYFEEIKGKVKEMKEDCAVDDYSYLTAVSQQYVLYLSDTYSQEYVSVLGYEDSAYPLENVMNFVSGRKNMSELLDDKNGIVISELLAERNNIQVGDTITLVSSDLFKNETFKVIDLIKKDYQGSIYSVFINGDRLNEFEDITDYLFYIDGDQTKISKELSAVNENMFIQTLDSFVEDQQESDRSFVLFLRGLSVLGLFIGSFGIASAVKVIINKRRRELGILKSIGFTGKDIAKMLLMEVSTISVAGGILGVFLGYAFFYYLVNILSSSDNLSIVVNSGFNWTAAAISFFVSIISSILFAYLYVKNISEIKPVYALKDIEYIQTKKGKGKNALRFLFVGIIFCGISIFLAQSVVYGIGAVVLIAVLITVFSLIFKLIFSLILKIPVKTHNEFELSWMNLRLNYKKIIVSMIAIFIGITAVSLIDTLVYSTKQIYSERYKEVDADINIVTDRANPSDNGIEDILKNDENVNNYIVLYKTQAEYDSDYLYGEVVGADLPEMKGFFTIIDGKQDLTGVIINANERDNTGYNIGDSIKINGKEFPITGIYDINYDALYSSIASLSYVNFVSAEEFKENFSDKYIEEIWISTDKDNIDSVLNDISDIPGIFITSSKQYEDMLNSGINILINFSTSVASLALLAGIILIITVTVLDVVSRRRDFAIYKVVGFKQKEVSAMVLLEYGLMTFITSVFASFIVYLFTIFMNRYGKDIFDINEKVYFDFGGSIIWDLGLMVLVLLLVYLVSRKTLKVKPNEVLRYE